MEKENLAQKMAERARKSTFNKVLKVIRAEADKGNRRVVKLNLDDYTKRLFEAEGFTLTDQPYYSFTQTVITF